MTSRRDGCNGKRRHPDKAGACIAAGRMRNCAMNVYPCGKCKGWHVGRTRDPYRTVARIDEILRQHARALQRRLAARDSDGSGEAGETALAGSTEGDSAVP